MVEITYSRHGDILLPDFALPEQPPAFFGLYGRLRHKYLKNHRKGFYTNLLTSGKLTEHIAEVDQQAKEQLDVLMREMAERQGITEELKANKQMAWVGAMNNIKACAEEIVINEIVYA